MHVDWFIVVVKSMLVSLQCFGSFWQEGQEVQSCYKAGVKA